MSTVMMSILWLKIADALPGDGWPVGGLIILVIFHWISPRIRNNRELIRTLDAISRLIAAWRGRSKN